MTSKFKPGYLSKRTENICPSKDSLNKVYSSIIHINPKVETLVPQCSSADEQINKM